MELKKLYLDTKEKIRNSGIDMPELEASILMHDSLGVSISEIYSNPAMNIAENDLRKLNERLTRRLDREPSGYITGKREFYSRDFHVNNNVLIPRPETELLVERTLELIPVESNYTVLDVGAGSGCVAITLALERTGITVLAADLSFNAVNVAMMNTVRHAVSDRVFLINTDMLSAMTGSSVDVIVSNPPYVSDSDYAELPRDIREYEPRMALWGGVDGTEFIEKLISESRKVLRGHGICLIETGYDQAGKVSDIFKSFGYRNINIYSDINGIDRVVSAQWKE